ncbi:hypothetical protein OAN96_00065 [Candidatus Gracilibacteria bacterium]|nr:hypothetical protein [Candidatus Gracilibacteria bacterium]
MHATDAINFDVSPIKYEIDLGPGDSGTYTATLYNRGSGSVDIVTSTSDFEPTGNTGQPRFVRYSELVHPDQQLSTWITLDTAGFTITPKSTHVMNFTIDVPANATPGGHYGAVFFKKEGDILGSGIVGIHVDYGVLVLVNVSGEVVSTGSVDTSGITIGGGGVSPRDICPNGDTSGKPRDGKCSADDRPNNNPLGIDKCIIDLTPSNFDGKCIENPFRDNQDDIQNGDSPEDNNNDNNNLVDNGDDSSTGENSDTGTSSTDSTTDSNISGDNGGESDTPEENFNVVFDVPFENDGNTHIKPNGSIVVKDERGRPIKQIGEKLIKNDRGAVIGKEIVDYLPLNDEKGNVLPSSSRVFGYEWKGFPYRDINGEIAYRTPGEYYTLKNQKNSTFLMFWERVCKRKQFKTLTADIELSYINNEGKEIEFNSAKEFKIQYIEQYIGINPYVVLPLILFILLWLGWWWFILLFKRKRCINKDCEKRIKKKLKVCPNCEAIQDEKKFKAQKVANKKTSRKTIKKK